MNENEFDRSLRQALTNWADEVRIDEAAKGRAREQSMLQQAQESAHLIGSFVDWAEKGIRLAVYVTSRRTYSGRIIAVGNDFVVLRDEPADIFLHLDHVVTTRIIDDTGTAHLAPPTGDRAAPLPLSFTHVLARLSGQRPRVQLGLRGLDEIYSGELTAIGEDLITLSTESETTNLLHIPIQAIGELIITDPVQFD